MRCLRLAITQSLKTAHAHHIQRLMVIGNFALLAGLEPQALHRWYLGIYIDAFEWVELPNTLGMSQRADGGVIATKPYVSSAAYLQRGIEYRPKMQVDQVATVAGLVKKEVGVAVLPYLGVLPILGMTGVQTSEIVDGPLRSVGIVTRRLGNPTPVAVAAMEMVTDVIGELMVKNPGWILPPSSRKR